MLVLHPSYIWQVSAANAYEASAIRFCQEWLSGKDTFRLHTSGSTGKPKPIELTRTQMQASAELTAATFGLKPSDSALVCLNVEFVAGTMMLVRGLVNQLTLYVVEPSNEALNQLSPEIHFDFAAFVPLQLESLLQNASPQRLHQLNSMKAIIVGGAAINLPLRLQIQQLSVPVYSTYGMTETTTHVAIKRENGPIPENYFTVLDGVKIGIDQRHCLNIKGPMTNQQLIQTNDVVELLNDAQFRLVGRFDNIINSGGIKIQPEKVEGAIGEVLAAMGLTNRFFAYSIPDQRLGNALVLVVESSTNQSFKLDEINKALTNQLSRYEIPKKWFFVEKFVETPTSKIDKNATFAYLPQS